MTWLYSEFVRDPKSPYESANIIAAPHFALRNLRKHCGAALVRPSERQYNEFGGESFQLAVSLRDSNGLEVCSVALEDFGARTPFCGASGRGMFCAAKWLELISQFYIAASLTWILVHAGRAIPASSQRPEWLEKPEEKPEAPKVDVKALEKELMP